MIKYDVCVIGSGAAGSIVANHCVSAGLRVIVIEEGPDAGPETSNESLDAASPRAWVTVDGKRQLLGWPWTVRVVGGGTRFYGAASFRLHTDDFAAAQRVTGTDLNVALPFTLEDLEPYYNELDKLLTVAD